jgi:hypothetical protein
VGAISDGVERFILYNPDQKLYHCGGFLDGEVARAYLFHSMRFARQGLMTSLVDLGDKKAWHIQRVLVEWDQFGDFVKLVVVEDIQR